MEKVYLKLEQERDFGDIFNAIFIFIRQNFVALAKAILFYAIPLALIMGILLGLYQISALDAVKSSQISNSPFSNINASFFLMYIAMFLNYTILMGVVLEFMKLYHIHKGPNFSIDQLGKILLKDTPKLIFTSLIFTIIICIGTMLFIIPGIYLGVSLSFLFPIIIIEEKSISEAFPRCFHLIRKNWWITCLILVITGILASILSQVFQLPASIYTTLNTFHALKDSQAGINQPLLISFSIVSSIGSTLMQSLWTIGLGLQFFNLKEQKESTSLLNELETLGENEA